MVRIINNDIELTRGDSLYLNVALNVGDGNMYELRDTDILMFTLKKSYKTDTKDNEVLIKHGVNMLPIRIAPEDTENLDYGEYVYDIELRLENGDVFTVVEPHGFSLTEEVG